MLLTLILNLGMAAGVVVPPPPTPPVEEQALRGGGGKWYELIENEDSEIVEIVKLCLKTTII